MIEVLERGKADSERFAEARCDRCLSRLRVSLADTLPHERGILSVFQCPVCLSNVYVWTSDFK